MWHLKPPSRDLSQTFQFSLAPSPPPLPPVNISKVSSTVILLNRFSRKPTLEKFYLSSHDVPNENTSKFLRRKRGGVIIYCVTWLKRLASTSCSRFVQYTCFFLCRKRRRKRGGVILYSATCLNRLANTSCSRFVEYTCVFFSLEKVVAWSYTVWQATTDQQAPFALDSSSTRVFFTPSKTWWCDRI